MSNYTIGIRLTADGKELVGAARMSKEETDKLGESFRAVKSLAQELNAQQHNLALTLGNQAALIEKQKIASEGLAESYQKMIDGQASWLQKGAVALAAWSAIGIEKIRTAWDEFAEWSERQIKIWGIALAVGVSAAVIGAVYAAYKGVSFGVGLLTGESYKSANIDALIAMNSQIKTLQENLPLTATGASALNEALKGLGTSSEAYVSTLGSVQSAVRSNGEELDRLGVRYKDQDGNLLSTRETLQSAATVLATYTEGWDRNQAALAIGMGSEKEIQKALAVTAEKTNTAKARLIDYNLIIGEGTQEAISKYDNAMRAFQRESELTSKGFKRAIADNVMPILTDLAEFFRDGFPYVVGVFRYSLATITSLFFGLKTVFFIVTQSILDGISAIGLGLGGLATAAWKALTGDFSGAKDALIQGWEDAKARLGRLGDEIVAQASNNSAGMALAWGADARAANQAADAVEQVGEAWVAAKPKAAELAKAVDENAAAYRRLLASIAGRTAILQEELDGVEQLTEAEKTWLQLEQDIINGQIKFDAAMFAKVAAYLSEQDAVEKALEAKKRMRAEDQVWLGYASALIAKQEQMNDVIVGFNQAQSEKIQGIQFETRQIEAESALVGAGLLLKEDEIRLISEVRLAREQATAMREIDLQLERSLLALGPERNADYEQAAEALYNLAAAQRMALPDVLAAREGARLSNELSANSVREFNQLWSTVESTGKSAFVHLMGEGVGAFEAIGKSIKTAVIDLLYQLTVRKWIIQIGTSVAGALGIGAAANAATGASGGSNGLNTLSNASSLANLFSGGLDFAAGFAQTAFAPAAEAAAMIEAGTVGVAGAGMEAGALMTMGTALPYIGAALLAAQAFGLFGGGDHSTRGTGYYISGQAGSQGLAGTFYGLSASDEASYVDPLTGQDVWTQYFNTQLAGARAEIEKLSRLMGIDSAGLANQTYSVNATGPLDMPQTVGIAIQSVTNQMAEQLVPTIRSLQQANESLTQTFIRLAQAARSAAIPDALNRMGAAMALKDAWKGIAWSDLNPFPMTSAQKLSALAGEYSANLTGARANDLNAYNALAGSAQSYIEQARAEYASSQQYVDIYQRIQGEVGDVVQNTMTEQSNRLADMGISLQEIVANTANLDKRIVEPLKKAIDAWQAQLVAVQKAAATQVTAAVKENTSVTARGAVEMGLVLSGAESAAWIDTWSGDSTGGD